MNDITDLLDRGGVPATPDLGRSNRVPPYSGLTDPAGLEQLGVAIARATEAAEPTTVLVWDGVEDRVVGHVVARELGALVVRAMTAGGVLDYDGQFGPADRVVLVADAYRNQQDLEAMQALVALHNGQVVAVAALVGTPVLRAVADPEHVVVLCRTEDDR
jgi:hypothetical protein